MEKHEINNLKELLNHKGWEVLKKELEEEIGEIETLILDKANSEHNKLKYTEYDLLRGIRKNYKTLLEEPTTLIESFDVSNID